MISNFKLKQFVHFFLFLQYKNQWDKISQELAHTIFLSITVISVLLCSNCLSVCIYKSHYILHSSDSIIFIGLYVYYFYAFWNLQFLQIFQWINFSNCHFIMSCILVQCFSFGHSEAIRITVSSCIKHSLHKGDTFSPKATWTCAAIIVLFFVIVSFCKYPFFNKSDNFSPLTLPAVFLNCPPNASEHPLKAFLQFTSSSFSNYKSPLTHNRRRQSTLFPSWSFHIKSVHLSLVVMCPVHSQKCSDFGIHWLQFLFCPFSNTCFKSYEWHCSGF